MLDDEWTDSESAVLL